MPTSSFVVQKVFYIQQQPGGSGRHCYAFLTAPKLAKPLRREIWALCLRLADVTLVPVPDLRPYAQGALHRPTAHYRLLLSVCQLVHEEVLLTQESGEAAVPRFHGQ